MSFAQGTPSVNTLINSSNCIVLGNTSSGTALTVQQLGSGSLMNVATSTGSSALFVSSTGSTGQVGIGTASPDRPLTVSNGVFDGVVCRLVAGYSSNPGVGPSIDFSLGNLPTYSGASIKSLNSYGDAGGQSAHLAFYTANWNGTSGSLQERMRILAGGNVGIGTTSPNGTTHVWNAAATGGPKVSIGDNTAFAPGGLHSIAALTSTLGAGNGNSIILGRTNATNDAFQMTFMNVAQSSTTNYLGFNAYGSSYTAALAIQAGGNVGIGTTSPGAQLTLTSNLYAGGMIQSAGATGGITNQGAYMAWNLSTARGETDFINQQGLGSGGWNWYNYNSSNQLTANAAYLSSTGGLTLGTYSNAYTAPSGGLICPGNVGIGTASPATALDIWQPGGIITRSDGSAVTRQIITEYNNSGTNRWWLLASFSTTAGNWWDFNIKANLSRINNVPMELELNIAYGSVGTNETRGDVGNGYIQWWQNSTTGRHDMWLFATSFTLAVLDVTLLGQVSSNLTPSWTTTAPTASGTYTKQLDTSTTSKFTILTGGNVGIGTTSPQAPLHVFSNVGIALSNNSTVVYTGSGTIGYGYGGGVGAGTQFQFRILSQTVNRDNGAGPNFDYGAQGDLVFQRKTNNLFSGGVNDQTYTEVMRIGGATGYVGIGTTSPQQALDVVGNIRMNSYMLPYVQYGSASGNYYFVIDFGGATGYHTYVITLRFNQTNVGGGSMYFYARDTATTQMSTYEYSETYFRAGQYSTGNSSVIATNNEQTTDGTSRLQIEQSIGGAGRCNYMFDTVYCWANVGQTRCISQGWFSGGNGQIRYITIYNTGGTAYLQTANWTIERFYTS